MTTPERMGFKVLASLVLMLAFIGAFGQSQCKQIEASAKVVTSDKGKSIVVEFTDSKVEQRVLLSLFGPNEKRELNVSKTSFDNLFDGKFLIVVVGKTEEDNYCPKTISVTIN